MQARLEKVGNLDQYFSENANLRLLRIKLPHYAPRRRLGGEEV
jgi:hypothetical protein